MEYASYSGRSEDFAGKTLLLPGCSIGNLGQLAADLFINTCELQLCGQLLSSSLLSCFGENAYSEGAATPSTELQVFTAENLVALQQRAPTPLGREVAFADELVQWISDSKFKQVILLASIDASIRRGPQLQGSQLRFQTSNEALGSTCQRLEFTRLEDPGKGEPASEDGLLPPWPTYRKLNEAGIPVVVLTRFTSEGGGNLADAAELVSYGYALLKEIGQAPGPAVSDWKAPVSWKHLFGSQQHTVIY